MLLRNIVSANKSRALGRVLGPRCGADEGPEHAPRQRSHLVPRNLRCRGSRLILHFFFFFIVNFLPGNILGNTKKKVFKAGILMHHPEEGEEWHPGSTLVQLLMCFGVEPLR